MSTPDGASGGLLNKPLGWWREKLAEQAKNAGFMIETTASFAGPIVKILPLQGTSLHSPIIIADDAVAQMFYYAARRVMRSFHLLIQGEPGTGKELVAQYASAVARPGKACVPVNCGTLAPSLLQSELFGYVRGAFSGANDTRSGIFEEANGGVVLLDEITAIPLEGQPALLRVLQERKARRVGDTREFSVDVVAIAATNEDVASLVDTGMFRQDLYERFGFTVQLPPLRARAAEIPILARAFLNQSHGTEFVLDEDAIRALQQHQFSGNVRELKEVIRRSAMFAEDEGNDHINSAIMEASLPRMAPTMGSSVRRSKAGRPPKLSPDESPELCRFVDEQLDQGRSYRKTEQLLHERYPDGINGSAVSYGSIYAYDKRRKASKRG